MDVMSIFSNVMKVVNGARQAVAAAPEFIELAQSVMPIFTGAQQDDLKSALAAARARSDAAEDDFVKASRG